MDKVPRAVHGKVFFEHRSSRQGLGVPRAEARDDDSNGVCG